MSSQAKPNIVVIWAPHIDEPRRGGGSRGRRCTPGARTPGEPVRGDRMRGDLTSDDSTPSLDRLAREGMRFINRQLEPGTSAAVEFMSGQSASPSAPARGGAIVRGRRRDATLAAMLRVRGYATGQFGGARPAGLEDCLTCLDGFDELVGESRARLAGERRARETPPAPTWWARFGRRAEPAASEPGDAAELSDEELVARALAFMRRQRALGVPFFAWLRVAHTHSISRPADRARSSRADALAAHDGNVGDVLDLLDRLGIAEETFLVYSVEETRGSADAPEAMAPCESRAEVAGRGAPLLVRWPGRISAASTCNGVIHLRDWLPTLAAVAGVPRLGERLGAPDALRAGAASHVGVNVLPHLLEEGAPRSSSGLRFFDDDGARLTFRYDNWDVRRREPPATVAADLALPGSSRTGSPPWRAASRRGARGRRAPGRRVSGC